jgi:hypothetical protein
VQQQAEAANNVDIAAARDIRHGASSSAQSGARSVRRRLARLRWINAHWRERGIGHGLFRARA